MGSRTHAIIGKTPYELF